MNSTGRNRAIVIGVVTASSALLIALLASRSAIWDTASRGTPAETRIEWHAFNCTMSSLSGEGQNAIRVNFSESRDHLSAGPTFTIKLPSVVQLRVHNDSDYTVWVTAEMLDSSEEGTPSWRLGSVAPNSDGEIALELPAERAQPGEYLVFVGAIPDSGFEPGQGRSIGRMSGAFTVQPVFPSASPSR